MGKILVVEDNDVLRGSVVQALVENGHNVSEVGDGEEATGRLQEESYDVVLTDMRMPKKSGLEVLRFAKQVNDLTVAIVMTAFGTIESAVEAMKSGQLGFDNVRNGRATGGYPWKNGGCPDFSNRGRGCKTAAMIFPSGIVAYVAVNSDNNGYAGSIQAVLWNAFDAALK